jgi:hypothetical protein
MENSLVVSNNFTLADIIEMGNIMAKSGLFPQKRPEEVQALMLIAQAYGIHPARAAQDFDVIKGAARKKSEACWRDFLSMGGTFKVRARSETECTVWFCFDSSEITVTWNQARATKAGLWSKDNWRNYPQQMLWWRCVGEALSVICPAAKNGMYMTHEAQDMGDAERVFDSDPVVVSEPPPGPPGPPQNLMADGEQKAKEGVAALQMWWARSLNDAERDSLRGAILDAWKATAVAADTEKRKETIVEEQDTSGDV